MALPLRRSRNRRALTASAVRMLPEESTAYRQRELDWQRKSLGYVDIIPELNYASRFYSRMLKRTTIFPAFRGTDDKPEPIESGLPVEILDRIQDPGGGRSQLQGSYGRLMFITGEGNLFGRNLGTDDERWAFVWNGELEYDGESIVWKPTYSGEPQVFGPGEAVAYRMWTAHPAKSAEADSPMRGVLEIAEELHVLTQAVRATAVSRMMNGLLKVPTELSFGSAEAGSDEDPEANPFLEDMIAHFTGVVENAGTPEAAAPFIAEAASEFLSGLEWMPIHDPQTDYLERELRRESIRRLAYGLDMPPEVLFGLAEANHWGGRQITHDMWRSHGAPIADQFCDDLSEAYLRPALREAGFERWQEVVVAYDDAEVIASADRTEDADKAIQNLGIGWEGYRKMKGIPENFAPSEEETKLLLALRLRDPSFLIGTQYEVESDLVPGERGPIPEVDTSTPAEEGPASPGPDGVTREEAARILGASELALVRCREIAGARIRSKMQSHPDFQMKADGHPNALVASLIGQEGLVQMGIPEPLKLVQGGTESFCSLLIERGFSEGQAQGLSEMLLVFAAKTLFENNVPPLPSGFISQVARAIDVSKVLGPSDRDVVRQNDESLQRLNSLLMGVKS